MVFKSHSGIPPYMTDYIRRSSEYQKEFKDWSSAIAKTNQHARPKRIRDDMDVSQQTKSNKFGLRSAFDLPRVIELFESYLFTWSSLSFSVLFLSRLLS